MEIELAEVRAATSLKRRIVQGLLGQALAVVEIPLHPVAVHVVAEGPQLMGLAGRDATVGIQNHHPEAGPAVEGRGHGTARIARGGDQHGLYRVVVGPQLGQAGGEKARSKILEGGGRAVKQLQHPGLTRLGLGHFHHGQRQIQGIGSNHGKAIGKGAVGEERRQRPLGRGRQRVRIIEGIGRKLRNLLRHEQPTVRRQAGAQRCLQRHRSGLSARTQILHRCPDP